LSFEQNYSALDRLIHRVAFSTRTVQLPAADLEGSLYGKAFKGIAVERPIFVTSLPRAGTTLLLEALSGVPGHASHTYRDMPFVLAPYLWSNLSKGFRQRAVAQERAHGDGMEVSYDSAEAFEEVVWRTFWPAHFEPDRIVPWSVNESNRDFEEFFVDHVRKIIALRVGGAGRYVSKNNANIARVGVVRRLFPDCVILVPFREPLDHAASMHRQHMRFLDVHAREPFSKRYMADIGHYEFGALHRPIDFPGMASVRERHEPDRLDYWVGYWASAFEALLDSSTDLVFLSYERMCARGAPALKAVEDSLRLEADALVDSMAGSLRSPRTYEVEDLLSDGGLLERALSVHERLVERSVT
jgi:hypothetical protein